MGVFCGADNPAAAGQIESLNLAAPIEEWRTLACDTSHESRAQRLKRVFSIDIARCEGCGGAVRIIACIEDPEVIEKILRPLGLGGGSGGQGMARAPPVRAGLID